MEHNFIRYIAAAAGAALWAVIRPAVPHAMICTAMIVADMYTAYRLSRRVATKNRNRSSAGKLISTRLGRMCRTIAKAYFLLFIAAAVDRYITLSETYSVLRIAAGAVIFWQAISILENEASCSDRKWAAHARKFLIDKAHRHLSIND